MLMLLAAACCYRLGALLPAFFNCSLPSVFTHLHPTNPPTGGGGFC